MIKLSNSSMIRLFDHYPLSLSLLLYAGRMQQRTIRILSIAFFIALLLWGVYTLITYLGIPVHGAVLVKQETNNSLLGLCTATNFLCRGLYSFFPFVQHTIARMYPLLWYGVISVALYAVAIGWGFFKRGGELRFQFRMRPWHILLLFAVSLFFIFNALSYLHKEGQVPMRQIIEPTQEIYRGVNPEGLITLQENFTRLQDMGCLRAKGILPNGANLFEMRWMCIQGSFFTRVLPPFIFMLFLLSVFLVAGRAVLTLLRMRPSTFLIETVVSAGMGAAAVVVLLWTMAVLSLHFSFLPLFSSWGGWALLFLILVVGFRHTLHWFRRLISAHWDVDQPWHSVFLLLVWLLISYLAFNFLTVIRPFPIGWDDLGSYLNRPRLLVSYGHFIYSMAAFQWEYLTSLGFLLFGYESTFGATIAMIINWTAGLLAVLTVYVFARTFLGRSAGVLSALLYYTLPMVGHFSFADMKIDNAVFTMGALSTFCLFLFLFKRDDQEQQQECNIWPWLIAAAIFGGIAFAMKPTSIMVIMALGAVLVGVMLHWSAFIVSVLLATVMYMLNGTLDYGTLVARVIPGATGASLFSFLLVCAIVAALVLGWGAWVGRKRLVKTVLAVGIFAGVFLVSISPWILHNNILWGRIIPTIDFGAPNNITPIFDIHGIIDPAKQDREVRTLPPDLQIEKDGPHCKASGAQEELGRYWGFRQGWEHYLTLPWRSVMDIDSAGYYVMTMPGLLLIPLLLLLPFFWLRKGRWIRWLFFGTLFMLFQWMFLANGIPWYGVGMFLGLVVLLETFVIKAPDIPSRVLASLLITFSILIVLSLRFWQFETQANLLEYPIGKASAEVMIERTIPYYNDIAQVVVERHEKIPDRPYLYRVGTFIPYFIPRNFEIIGVADHQLDFFNCLYQERDDELTLQRLKVLGMNSIIFDTNTATIEKDLEGSLHQKVNAFVQWVNNPALGLNVVVSDTDAGVAFILIP